MSYSSVNGSVLATPRTQPGSSGRFSRGKSSSRTPQSSTPIIKDAPDSSMIIAVVQGRGHSKNEVGIAAMSLKSPHILLSQFTDSATFVRTMAKLHIFNPMQIVTPETMTETQNYSQAITFLHRQFPRVSIVPLPRNYFDENRGNRTIQKLCSPEYSSVILLAMHKYYSLAAASALLRYIEITENMVFAQGSLRIEFQSAESTMLIDAATAQRLELTGNLTRPGGPSLYSALNHCQIASGSRLLRSTLLEPPRDVCTILQRQNCVEELVTKPELFYSLQAILGRFVDVDSLLWQCVQVPKQITPTCSAHQINSIISLKHTLELIPHFVECLETAENSYMIEVREETRDPRYGELLKKIEQVIAADARHSKSAATMRFERHFAIRANVNEFLDVCRRTYIELIGDVKRMVDQLADEFKLPLTMSENATRGFHLQMPLTGHHDINIRNLHKSFIQVQKHKNFLSFTTEGMATLDNRIKETIHEMDLLCGTIASALLGCIRKDIHCLYKLSDALSRLDLFVAMAHVSSIGGYRRPQFGEAMAIKKGRHPILDRFADEPPSPNDTYLSPDISCQLITGPNMSGKSTYLRQVALLQIMAQVGCFIPMEFGVFRIIDQLFSRLGSQENIECNASCFMVEMLELNYIVQNATDFSLIVMDELGKHTCPEEGCALSWAVTEHILKTKAFTIIATHLMPLTKLAETHLNVKNFFMEVEEDDSENEIRLRPTYALIPGVTEVGSYGMKLAEVLLLPKAALERAKELRTEIAANYKFELAVRPEYKIQKACFSLAYNLMLLAKDKNSGAEAKRDYIKRLSDDFQRDIAGIGQ